MALPFQQKYHLNLSADTDFLLKMISAAQLFPICVWNFPESHLKKPGLFGINSINAISSFYTNKSECLIEAERRLSKETQF